MPVAYGAAAATSRSKPHRYIFASDSADSRARGRPLIGYFVRLLGHVVPRRQSDYANFDADPPVLIKASSCLMLCHDATQERKDPKTPPFVPHMGPEEIIQITLPGLFCVCLRAALALPRALSVSVFGSAA